MSFNVVGTEPIRTPLACKQGRFPIYLAQGPLSIRPLGLPPTQGYDSHVVASTSWA